MKRAALFCILSNLSISLLVYGSHIKHPYSRVDLTIAKQANFLQSWWHWRRFLGRKPSVQLALLVILLMWLLHFKSSKMLKVLSMDFSLLVRECADLVGRSSSISVSCPLCNISLRWISCPFIAPSSCDLRSSWRVWWSCCDFISLYKRQSSAKSLTWDLTH